MLTKKDYEKIVEYLNFLAVGTTDVVTKEQEKEILDLSCKCYDYAYPDSPFNIQKKNAKKGDTIMNNDKIADNPLHPQTTVQTSNVSYGYIKDKKK